MGQDGQAVVVVVVVVGNLGSTSAQDKTKFDIKDIYIYVSAGLSALTSDSFHFAEFNRIREEIHFFNTAEVFERGA